MTGRMPEYMSDEMSENMSDRMPDRLPDRMPGGMSGYMPDRMPEYMPEYMSDRMSEYTKYMSKYTSWHVMVGITRSRVIHFRAAFTMGEKVGVTFPSSWGGYFHAGMTVDCNVGGPSPALSTFSLKAIDASIKWSKGKAAPRAAALKAPCGPSARSSSNPYVISYANGILRCYHIKFHTTTLPSRSSLWNIPQFWTSFAITKVH